MSDPTTSRSHYITTTPSTPDFSLKEAFQEAKENADAADTHAKRVTADRVKLDIGDSAGGLIRGRW